MNKAYSVSVDNSGRLVIPREMRKTLGLHKGSKLTASLDNCVIKLSPMSSAIKQT